MPQIPTTLAINVQAHVHVPDSENQENYDLSTVVVVPANVADVREAAMSEAKKHIGHGESFIKFDCQVATVCVSDA